MTTTTMAENLTGSRFQFVNWADLTNWSVRFALENRFQYNPAYELQTLGSFLRRVKNEVVIQDQITYQRVTVRVNNRGVVPRDTAQGRNIGTKRQFQVAPGQFLVSRIDARHGAMGLVPDELAGAVVTADFLPFEVDTTQVDPRFLVLITSTREFIRFCQSCSSGTTNRQRLDEQLFLAVKIPLPTLDEQRRLVSAHEAKTELAQQQREEAEKLKIEAAAYLINALGLNAPEEKKEKAKGWQFVDFSGLTDRWDYLASDYSLTKQLHKAYYPLQKIGQVYSFVKRVWNSKNHSSPVFRYIEIGGVDPLTGITSAEEITVKKAPSRATQLVCAGDLIIATTRPYLKKFALVTAEYDGCVCSSGFSLVRENDDVYSLSFLKEFLMSYYGIEQLKNRMTGALYPAITESELKNIDIPIPPIVEQKNIIREINRKKLNAQELFISAEALEVAAVAEFEEAVFEANV